MSKVFQKLAGAFFVLLSFFGFASLGHSASVDPEHTKNQYLYGENIGWVNAHPNGGGVQVDANDVSGYLWAENVGWINLSCKNKDTCGTVNFGVKNDGKGALSGYAWGENIGWINFKPQGGGVTIDPGTGVFNGKAWGENIGWLSFRSSLPAGFQVTTAWRSGAETASSELVQAEGSHESNPTLNKNGSSKGGGSFWSCQMSDGDKKFEFLSGIIFGPLPFFLIARRKKLKEKA